MRSKRSKEFDEKCIRLYCEGHKTIDICRSMGIADRTLYKILSDHSVVKKKVIPLVTKKIKDREKALLVRRSYLEERLSVIRASQIYERQRTLAMLEVTNAKLAECRAQSKKDAASINPRSADLRVPDVSSMVGDIPWSYGED